MRIALMNENSQAAKNGMIEASLKKVVEPMGHEVVNFGMYTAEDACQLTYVKIGLLACILLETKAVDYVVTGCGTGEGAMLACNSFPGVLCGHLCDPSDGYMFAHINDGNCVALPFAKDFGWGAELKLEMIFQQLFGFGHGQGYPKERVIPEQRNKKILDEVKKVTHRKLIEILHDIDQDFLLDEHAREMCGEWMRWFTLKRFRAFESRLPKCNPQITEFDATKHYVRPVPTWVLANFENGDEYQNPGY